MSKKRKIGWGLLVVGILCLIVGLVMGFTVGTKIVPTLMGGSVLINTVAVMLIRETI